jgi:hypothetical protein
MCCTELFAHLGLLHVIYEVLEWFMLIEFLQQLKTNCAGYTYLIVLYISINERDVSSSDINFTPYGHISCNLTF